MIMGNRIRNLLKACLWSVVLIVVLGLVVYDSIPHFDIKIIELKKAAHSAQRDWSVFFGQHHVYESGGLKHSEDFRALANIIEPGSGVLADIATSYYMAASLPVYVRNIHRHHGRYRSEEWNSMLASNMACYLNVPENLQHFKSFIAAEEVRASNLGIAPIRYIAINKEQKNINFKRDCLSQTRSSMYSTINGFAKVVYEGETILLYRLTTAPSYHN